ncbi:MAG: EthD domain-containing protein [Novosphingobium sp.]|nr:EthD domain-containing protein [Novosphingobium sp.]
MTVKMYGLIPPKPGMDRDEFHDYYRHPHGTMGQNMTTMRGYVQNHRIDTNRLPEMWNGFEAVAEIWLDNVADALSFRDEPVLVKYLIEDEPKFVDMDNLAFFAGESEVLTSGPAQNAGLHPGDELWNPRTRPFTVKLLHFINTDGNADWSRDDDADLGKRLGAFRHTRALPLEAMHGDNPSFLGLQEFWWPTRTDFHRAVDAAPDALQELLDRAGSSTTFLVQAERFI